MCSPAATAIISTGLQIAGSAMQARHSAQSAGTEAKEIAARGAREADLARRENARDLARQRVAMLKGGVTTAGSPGDALLDLAREGEERARWTALDHTQAARARERAAREARRRGVLDSLTSANNLGDSLLRLKQ